MLLKQMQQTAGGGLRGTALQVGEPFVHTFYLLKSTIPEIHVAASSCILAGVVVALYHEENVSHNQS